MNNRPQNKGIILLIFIFLEKENMNLNIVITPCIIFKNYQKDFSCIILFPNDKSLSVSLLNQFEKYIIYDIEIQMDNFKNNFKK